MTPGRTLSFNPLWMMCSNQFGPGVFPQPSMIPTFPQYRYHKQFHVWQVLAEIYWVYIMLPSTHNVSPHFWHCSCPQNGNLALHGLWSAFWPLFWYCLSHLINDAEMQLLSKEFLAVLLWLPIITWCIFTEHVPQDWKRAKNAIYIAEDSSLEKWMAVL